MSKVPDPKIVQVDELRYIPHEITKRKRVQKHFPNPSLTKQCFKDDCDINKIIDRCTQLGVDPSQLRNGKPFYGDFSELPSYQESLQTVMTAEEQFSKLPAKVRHRFENDPSKLIDFVMDPSNLEESYDLGLRERPQVAKESDSEAEAQAKPKASESSTSEAR